MNNPLPLRIIALWRSFAARIFLLATVFMALPVILYGRFEAADREKMNIVRQSVETEGRLIAESLYPRLAVFKGGEAAVIADDLARLGGQEMKLKLFLRPANGNFFYITASPAVSEDYLESERQEIMAAGLLDRFMESCAESGPAALRYVNPAGTHEVITSITPVLFPDRCWIVIVSHDSRDFLESSFARPYWQTPQVRLAFFMYLLAVLVTFLLFGSLWGNLRGFAALARDLRHRGEASSSFRAQNRIPELSGVADEFDRMVHSLKSSAEMLRHLTEESAHALKGPLGVIAQSLEPLRRAVEKGDLRAKRALEMVEKSVLRLDHLISAARRLEHSAAELMDPPNTPVDLSAVLSGMAEECALSVREKGIRLARAIDPGISVRGSEDMFETIIENLLDNAASFSPPGSTISLSLHRAGGLTELVVEDEGPGVPEGDLEKIFERGYSRRPQSGNSGTIMIGVPNFGLGLWIVCRRIESLNGHISASNRQPRGFRISVILPLAA